MEEPKVKNQYGNYTNISKKAGQIIIPSPDNPLGKAPLRLGLRSQQILINYHYLYILYEQIFGNFLSKEIKSCIFFHNIKQNSTLVY